MARRAEGSHHARASATRCHSQRARSLQLSWKLAADIARERKLLQLRVIYLCDRFGISQDRMWNLDETAVPIVPAGERGWTKKAASAHVFASRAFITVTLASSMRDGMWKNIIHEEKSDRVHRHGPAFPCQLVSHSPTHWITQEALLDMIDAIDADMHARAGDAELAPWLLLLDCRAFKSSIRSEVAKHFAEFFLEAESNFEHINLDSSTAVLRQLLLSFVHTAAQNADSPQHRTAGWRFIDWNEVEQRELPAEAKRLLETGELFPRGTAEEPHAPDAEAEASDSEPEAHVMEPLADDQQRRRGRAHWCRGISGTSGCRCSRESRHESALRGCKQSVSYTVANHHHDSTSAAVWLAK